MNSSLGHGSSTVYLTYCLVSTREFEVIVSYYSRVSSIERKKRVPLLSIVVVPRQVSSISLSSSQMPPAAPRYQFATNSLSLTSHSPSHAARFRSKICAAIVALLSSAHSSSHRHGASRRSQCLASSRTTPRDLGSRRLHGSMRIRMAMSVAAAGAGEGGPTPRPPPSPTGSPAGPLPPSGGWSLLDEEAQGEEG
jgi:hypothetical protein